MERDTILMLDTQMHRGGVLEQGLNSRGLNVFRTSRSREASNLLRVLKPTFLIVALEGEGKEFYERYVVARQVGQARCLLLAAPTEQPGREGDVVLDADLPPTQLVAKISHHMQEAADSPKNPGRAVATPRAARTAPKATASYQGTAASNRLREWKGNLSQLDIARLYSILVRRRATGKLLLSQGAETRRVWLHNGHIVAAESNQPVPHLSAVLFQDGVLERQHIEQFAEVLAGPKPGERLFELGVIDRAKLEVINRRYIEQTVHSSFTWEEGGFCFLPEAEDLPSQPTPVELASLLVRGIREGYRADRLLRVLGGEHRVPRWALSKGMDFPIRLNVTEQQMVQHIDGQRSLGELLNSLHSDPSAFYPVLYALMVLGFVTMDSSEQAAGAPATSPSMDRRNPPGTIAYDAMSPSGMSSRSDDFLSRSPTPHEPQGGYAPQREQVESPGRRRVSRTRSGSQTPVGTTSFTGGGRPGTGSFQATNARTPADPYQTPISRKIEQSGPATPRSQQTPQGNAPIFSNLPPKSAGSLRSRPPTMSYRAVMPPTRMPRPKARTGEVNRVWQGEEQAPQARFVQEQIRQKYEQVMTADYFEVLEVSNQAGDLEIRRAYQRIKQSFADGRFSPAILEKVREQLKEIQQTIQEAYEVLGDPALRTNYAQNLAG